MEPKNLTLNAEKLDRQTLFCDGNEDFRIPPEPDAGEQVTLRFRTAKNNADRVYYVEEGKTLEMEMEKADSDEMFDYYGHHFTIGGQVVCYRFRVERGEEICHYNRLGTVMGTQSYFSFRITPGFHIPEQAKSAVMYWIFVDRFRCGDTNDDVETGKYVYVGRPIYRVDKWDRYPSTMDVGCFCGGDLQGVRGKLGHIQSLGVEVVYFNPIFMSPSDHKYDYQDYDHIGPHYGKIVKDGEELVAEDAKDDSGASKYVIRSTDKANLDASDKFFADFMEEIRSRGMRIIIDGVFNHCGSFSKWLDRGLICEWDGSYDCGAYMSADSSYWTFFKFFRGDAWSDNPNYDGWWDRGTLPKLNYEESPKLYEYIMSIARK